MELFHDPEFWILVAFVLVIGLTFKPAKRALLKTLDDRTEKIRADLDRAAKLHKDATALLADYQQKQRDAIKEAEQIVAAAKAEAERLSQQAAADLEVALKRREQMALQRIAQAEQQAMKEVRAAAVDVAVAATAALLKDKLDAGRQDALIDSAIKELQGKLN